MGFSIALLLLTFGVLLVHSQPSGAAELYVNARFGFSAELPDGMTALPESENGDGRAFEDPATGLSVHAAASYNVFMEDAVSHAARYVPKGVSPLILGEGKDADDSALSWHSDGKTFWLRVRCVRTAQDEDGTLLIFYAQCPTAQESACREAVLSSLKSLKPTRPAR